MLYYYTLIRQEGFKDPEYLNFYTLIIFFHGLNHYSFHF